MGIISCGVSEPSPNDLTPEAQTVFANCAAYISRFKGQGPLMRKFRTVMTVRDFVDDFITVRNAGIIYKPADPIFMALVPLIGK